MKTNENEGGASPDGFASLSSTPGMGEVVMPTEKTTGSGDVWGNVLGFDAWRKKGKKQKKRKRRRSQ